MKPEELAEILKAHALWLRGEAGGKRANLADAYLAGANLTGANLAGANLAGANLADAYLADAYLAGANLAGANLTDAYLAGAYLADAYLAGANLTGANREITKDSPEVPVIPELHQAMEAVTRDRAALDMSQWHSCATTHCRAGWAITLAGEAGERLEEKVGSFLAGCLIYDKSTGYVPHFFASTEAARADIGRCASLPMGVRGNG